MDPYDRLVWEVWMPRVRSLVLNWSPRNCDPMVQLLEVWSPLLPGWVMENVLDQLVLPRIQAEQESWDPTTDIMPIHKWIHPWLPLMGGSVIKSRCGFLWLWLQEVFSPLDLSLVIGFLLLYFVQTRN